MSRQFADVKSELEADKAAFLAQKQGVALSQENDDLPESEMARVAATMPDIEVASVPVTVPVSEVTRTTSTEADARSAARLGSLKVETFSDSQVDLQLPIYSTTDKGKIRQSLNPSAADRARSLMDVQEPRGQLVTNAASSGRFSFNPAQLLARDRWSQVWTSFLAADQPAEDRSTTAASLNAQSVPAVSASPAVILSQNLKEMEVEKPVKWVKAKAKVSAKEIVNFFLYVMAHFMGCGGSMVAHSSPGIEPGIFPLTTNC